MAWIRAGKPHREPYPEPHLLTDQTWYTALSEPHPQTLKGILESDSIPNVFFDIRNDSDALFSHFGISIAAVHDIQLMELATRNFSKRCISGLSKCIERDISLTISERKG
jgi:exonuclease 3'-5' domain-containing protein 1